MASGLALNFTGIFQGFCLLFRIIFLKEHLCLDASVYFSREASQGSTCFLLKYYSWEYLNVKIPNYFMRSTYFLERVLHY